MTGGDCGGDGGGLEGGQCMRVDVPTLPRGTGYAAKNRRVSIVREPESIGQAAVA